MNAWFEKDEDEAAACALVREGVLACEEAQAQMREWRPTP